MRKHIVYIIFVLLIGGVSCRSATLVEPTASLVEQTQITTAATTSTPLSSPIQEPYLPSLTPTLPFTATHTPTPIATPLSSPIPTPIFRGKIAALVQTRSQVHDLYEGSLYLINLETQEEHMMFEGVLSYEWSPTGHQIVLGIANHETPAYAEMYLISANGNGSQAVKLEPPLVGGAGRYNPTWSPDETQIAFGQFDGGVALIHIMDLDSNTVQFLTEGAKPAWSPTGDSIAFLRLAPSATGDIFIIDTDGNNLRQLTQDIQAGQPAWSSDGTHLAFYALDSKALVNNLYIIDVATGKTQILVPDIGNYPVWPPSWLPDSSNIIFRQNGLLYNVDINSSEVTLLKLPTHFYYLSGSLQPKE